MKTNILYRIGLINIVGILGVCCSLNTICAAEITDELWGQPTVVYGGGLSQDNVNEIAEKFDISRSNVQELYTSGEMVSKYLGTNSTSTGSLISCVKVEKKSSGYGVKVNIVTPENITRITETQYANAAITAGVTNVQIDVASLNAATGESALTGVYMALEVNGENVDTERSEVAQEELTTTNEIAQNNADNSGFNTNDLDQALIDIKTELAELKERQGAAATTEQIEQIISEVLNKCNLSNILSQEDINKLINFAEKYQNTSAIDSEEVLNQLKNLSNNISDFLSSEQAQGLIDKIVSWFQELFRSITNLFN